MARTGGPEAPAWLAFILIGGVFLGTAVLTRARAPWQHLGWMVGFGGLALGGGLWLLGRRLRAWARRDEPLPAPWWGLGFGALALAAGQAVLRVNAVSEGPPRWEVLGWLISAAGGLGLGLGAALGAGWLAELRQEVRDWRARRPSPPPPLTFAGELATLPPVLQAGARRLSDYRVEGSAARGLQRVEGRTPRGVRVAAQVERGALELGVELPRPGVPLEVTSDALPADLRGASGPVPGDDALGGEAALRLLFGAWRARRLWSDGQWLRVELGVAPDSLAPAWADDALEALRRLPELVEAIRAITGGASAAPGSPRRALLRALPRWLDALRVEPRPEQDEDVASGRRGGRSVTLRLAANEVTLSFDLPFRAAFDLSRHDLPASVRAALEGGPAVEGDPEAALVTLFGPLGCQRLWAHARRAHATLPLPTLEPDVDADAWAERALALVARLDGLARSPVVLTARRAESAVCPYCRDAAEAGADGVAPCEGCETLHHVECLEEAGGCTVLGCASSARRSGRVRVT